MLAGARVVAPIVKIISGIYPVSQSWTVLSINMPHQDRRAMPPADQADFLAVQS
jgi:hypothetical protein